MKSMTANNSNVYGSDIFERNVTGMDIDDYVLLSEFQKSFTVFLLQYGGPIISVVAISVNCLIIFVLTREKHRKHSTSLYLTSLAVSDILISTFGQVYDWIRLTLHHRNPDEHNCQLKQALVVASVYNSSWILAVITVERVIAMWKPHRSRHVCSSNVSKLVIFVTWVISLAFGSAFVFMFHLVEKPNGMKVCEQTAIFPIYISVHVLLKFFLPFTVIFVGSVLIIYGITKKNPVLNQQAHPGRVSTMAVSVIIVNTVFFITLCPMTVFQISLRHLSVDYKLRYRFQISFWANILISISFLNSVMNFFIYFWRIKKFRTDTIDLFCCKNGSTCSCKHFSQKNRVGIA